VRREILGIFVEAARQVFREMDISVDSVGPTDAPDPEDQVITSVGVTGDLKGIFMLRTDTAGAQNILRAMTGGMGVTLREERLSEMQMAAIGELSNQIAGRAITLLEGSGLACDITPPAVMAARQLQSLVPDLAVSFRQAVSGAFGRVVLFLGLQESELRDFRPKN
jgi:CheY-specific phosphatase CheX